MLVFKATAGDELPRRDCSQGREEVQGTAWGMQALQERPAMVGIRKRGVQNYMTGKEIGRQGAGKHTALYSAPEGQRR